MIVRLGDYGKKATGMRSLRIGSRLDKYRLLRRLGAGGFSTVYAALDTLEGRRVALKIPESQFVANPTTLEGVKREIRIAARLDHPHLLPLKDARFIDGFLVMVFPLGEETLADRLTRRMARTTAVHLAGQMIAAVAYAHEQKVLHRDIKPENFILFPANVLRLTDFGLAKVGRSNAALSGSGTLGYMAPEQAMGRPTYRSDVFSLGLILYRMFSGKLPEYPFHPPLNGAARLRRDMHPDLVALVRKAIDPLPSRRFRDAVALRNAYQQIRNPLRPAG